MTRYLKFLAANGTGPYSGFAWSLPVQAEDGAWTPGAWVRVEGALVVCERGLHATTPEHAADWLAATCYELQYRRRPRREGNKVVGREARLTRRLHWDDRTARHFACDCAERALPIYERAYPGDRRPREAIATARRYADGQATRAELAAAGDAADAAAKAAARAAAWAAWDAARAAERAWQTERLLAYLDGEVQP